MDRIFGKFSFLFMNFQNFYKKIIVLFFLLVLVNLLQSEILSNEDLFITFHQNDRKIAEQILSRFYELTESVNREVGFYTPVGVKIHLILCLNQNDYENYVKKYKVFPERSEAFAVPKKKLIVIRNPKNMQINSNFYQVLTHEYNHILLHNIASNVAIPLWFDEGFAQYFANQWNIRKEFIFVKEALQGNTLELNSYNFNYPQFKKKREIFYLQSYYTTKYLISRFSKKQFQEFLDKLQNSQNFGKTFLKVYKISLSEFLFRVEKSIKSHAILTVFYSGFGLFWFIIPMLVFVAYLRKKILKKRIEENWQDDVQEDENSDGL